MDDRILARLRCPVCAEPLTAATAGTTRALRCPRGHSFDTARQGYVNQLAGRSPHTGDSAEMVAARADFSIDRLSDAQIVSDAIAGAAGVHALDGSGRTQIEVDEHEHGFEAVVLETGLRQPEAIGLYESSGYLPVPPFGYYKDEPLSRCYARRLEGTAS